jgi:flagellar protein FlgJ
MLGATDIQTTASVYTDFQGLDKMRLAAKEDPRKALESVAKQFESIFLGMVLKSMRDASFGDGLFDSDQTKFYQDMFDKQLALHMTRDRSVGLAQMMVRQLEGTLPKSHTGGAEKSAAPAQGPTDNGFAVPPRGAQPAVGAHHASSAIAESSAASKQVDTPQACEPTFDSPREFVEQLLPQARRAAKDLGVAPEALLAQAALETGWGKAVIRHPDGTSSHNLFNIKADQRWDGDSVTKQTLEYRDGVAVKEQAAFRSYDSFEESFQDYVAFLKDNPRYREALEHGAEPAGFAKALQKAGYATDPAYAQKIQRILGSDVMGETLAALKISPDGTLT